MQDQADSIEFTDTANEAESRVRRQIAQIEALLPELTELANGFAVDAKEH